MNSAQKKIIFLHISKTAGTTLRQVVIKNYAREEVAPCYGNESEKQECFSLAIKNKFPIIFGHLDFSFLNDQIMEEYELVSMMRNPVDQVISHYVHSLRSDDPKHTPYDDISMPEFLETYRGRNWQCQYLSGFKERPEALNSPAEMLEKALQNLNRLDFCGISENFSESLHFLKWRYNWKNLRFQPENRSMDQQLSRELKHRYEMEIRKHNEQDVILYQHALTLFDDKLRELRYHKRKKWFFGRFGS